MKLLLIILARTSYYIRKKRISLVRNIYTSCVTCLLFPAQTDVPCTNGAVGTKSVHAHVCACTNERACTNFGLLGTSLKFSDLLLRLIRWMCTAYYSNKKFVKTRACVAQRTRTIYVQLSTKKKMEYFSGTYEIPFLEYFTGLFLGPVLSEQNEARFGCAARGREKSLADSEHIWLFYLIQKVVRLGCSALGKGAWKNNITLPNKIWSFIEVKRFINRFLNKFN